MASPDVLAERIALLVEKDDYGVRHSLLEHVPQFLDSETIARLVDRWKKQAAQGPGSRRDRMPATCTAWASWVKRSARGRRLHPMSRTCRSSGRGMTSGVGQPGTGVLKVDGKEVATQKMDHTIPLILQWDETFDIGADIPAPRWTIRIIRFRSPSPASSTS